MSADVVQGRQPCALEGAPALVSPALVDRHLDRHLDHHLDRHQEGCKEDRQQDDQPDYHLDLLNHCRCCAERAALCSSHGQPWPYTLVMFMVMMVILVTMLTMMMMNRLLVMVMILRSREGCPLLH